MFYEEKQIQITKVNKIEMHRQPLKTPFEVWSPTLFGFSGGTSHTLAAVSLLHSLWGDSTGTDLSSVLPDQMHLSRGLGREGHEEGEEAARGQGNGGRRAARDDLEESRETGEGSRGRGRERGDRRRSEELVRFRGGERAGS